MYPCQLKEDREKRLQGIHKMEEIVHEQECDKEICHRSKKKTD